ncbi:MAG: lipid A biosynthesis acyltransferase [Gammaproteobacteria bacterium]|nr:lipid A biosynthesis acyltransferase [Gammaproteobacteria bacterium]
MTHSIEQVVLNRPVSSWGRLMYRFFPYRKKVIESNINQVFSEQLSPAAKKHLIKAFYSHFLKILQETWRLRFMTEEALLASVKVEGHEHLLDVAAKQQGVLVLTGHFGNWEFAPLAGILQFKEFKGHFHFIRKSIGFKALENILFKRYFKVGLKIINKTNALNKIVSALELNHAVVFVLDQHATLANKDGIAVEFFGKKAGTYRSLAMVSRYTEVPVVPAASYRCSDNTHVLKFYPPIVWEDANTSEQGLYQNTMRYNQALENIILEHPEQWWWLHKRWKI